MNMFVMPFHQIAIQKVFIYKHTLTVPFCADAKNTFLKSASSCTKQNLKCIFLFIICIPFSCLFTFSAPLLQFFALTSIFMIMHNWWRRMFHERARKEFLFHQHDAAHTFQSKRLTYNSQKRPRLILNCEAGFRHTSIIEIPLWDNTFLKW